uniref:Putative secreted protein n=1 Tax=Anopheles triannulatus TaxID=58253 RepID=A0A2M4B1K2_9DIPT
MFSHLRRSRCFAMRTVCLHSCLCASCAHRLVIRCIKLDQRSLLVIGEATLLEYYCCMIVCFHETCKDHFSPAFIWTKKRMRKLDADVVVP